MVQVVEEQMGRRGEAVHPLRPVLHRTLADVQERLTFRAQTFIKVLSHHLHHLTSCSSHGTIRAEAVQSPVDQGVPHWQSQAGVPYSLVLPP